MWWSAIVKVSHCDGQLVCGRSQCYDLKRSAPTMVVRTCKGKSAGGANKPSNVGRNDSGSTICVGDVYWQCVKCMYVKSWWKKWCWQCYEVWLHKTSMLVYWYALVVKPTNVSVFVWTSCKGGAWTMSILWWISVWDKYEVSVSEGRLGLCMSSSWSTVPAVLYLLHHAKDTDCTCIVAVGLVAWTMVALWSLLHPHITNLNALVEDEWSSLFT